MANLRLTVRTLSRNDISIIANLLEQSFDYYLDNNSPFFTDYLCSLRTVAGLGFAAALSDRGLLSIYQGYLNNFMRQNEGNFRESPGAKRHIAQSASEMIGTAVISFQALEHPRYYEDFLKDLHYTIARVPELMARKEAERILSGLAGNL